MADYDFNRSYPGPLGPHLSCLSKYTLTRKDEDRLRGESIHPRNWAGRGDKLNTRKAPTYARHHRSIAAIEAHLERHPGDKRSEARLASLKAEAAKAPAATLPLAA